MNFKKILSLLMIAAMLVCSLISCNEPEPQDPCTHADTDNNGVCDTCREGLPTVTYTVTVKDDSGRAVAGVEVGLDVMGAADVVYATTDNNGVATFTVDTDKTNRRIEAFIEDYAEMYKLGDNDAHVFAQGEKSCTLGLVELDAYYVYATDKDGNALAGVQIQACTPSGMCMAGKTTGADGLVVFYSDTALGYATVNEVPAGYEKPMETVIEDGEPVTRAKHFNITFGSELVIEIEDAE